MSGKVAIALRTCGSVFNYWNSNRIVSCSKPDLILTCLNSLLHAVKRIDSECVFSVHDDSSDQDLLDKMSSLFDRFGVKYELVLSGKLNNFKTQYEWCKVQDCNYVYCVEDDYLHRENALLDMVDMCNYMKGFIPGEYAIFPFNSPHRYKSFEMLYPSYIIKGEKAYWRSLLHSTHTFFVSKLVFDHYDNVMRHQAYTFPNCNEDESINKIWREQRVRLICPLDSLAYHIADSTQEDVLSDWKQLFEVNMKEVFNG